MAFKKQAIPFVVSRLYKNDSLHTCADVENNTSFIQSLPDRFLRSTKVKAIFLKFTLGNICKWFGQLFIVYILSAYVRDIRLNDKILHSLWRLIKMQSIPFITSQIGFAERSVIKIKLNVRKMV